LSDTALSPIFEKTLACASAKNLERRVFKFVKKNNAKNVLKHGCNFRDPNQFCI